MYYIYIYCICIIYILYLYMCIHLLFLNPAVMMVKNCVCGRIVRVQIPKLIACHVSNPSKNYRGKKDTGGKMFETIIQQQKQSIGKLLCQLFQPKELTIIHLKNSKQSMFGGYHLKSRVLLRGFVSIKIITVFR